MLAHALPSCRALLAAAVLSSAAVLAAADLADLDAAQALVRGRKFDEARQAFEKLHVADPKHGEVNFQLGDLALRRDDTENAVKYFEKAIAAEPQVGRYHRKLGDAYGRSAQKASVFSQFGLAKKCLAAYQRAVAIDPNDLDAHSSLFEYYRQAPGIVGGGMDKARAAAAEIKRLDPDRGRLALVTLYLAEKKNDLAFAEWNEVLKATPDDYMALFQIGRTAALTGEQLDRGLASLRRCLELTAPPNRPGHAAAHWRIGHLLEKKKDTAGARTAYETALKLDPKFTPAADSLKKLK